VRITADKVRGIPVLVCQGALTLGATDAFVDAYARVFDGGSTGLILDLSRLSYLDSAGVGAVVGCSTTGAARGCVVKIVLAPDGPVPRIFHLTQLERAFEIFAGVEEAAASFP